MVLEEKTVRFYLKKYMNDINNDKDNDNIHDYTNTNNSNKNTNQTSI